MGRLVYGYWDCHYCGSKGIRGDKRECPNCGHPRNTSTKFYMGENIEYVPAVKAGTISRNPDWLCDYCNTLNSDKSYECESCGSPRYESKKDYFDLHKNEESIKDDEEEIELDPNMSGSPLLEMPKVLVESWNTYLETSEPDIQKNKKSFKINPLALKITLISLASILLVFLMVLVLKTHDEEMTVTSFSWSKTIEIEKLVTHNESGWTLPSNARLQYTHEELKEYQDVFDHYETKTRQVQKERLIGYEQEVSGYRDLGNGMYEEIVVNVPVYETYYVEETYTSPVYRKEPVYAKKYYYEIDRWTYSRSVNTNGIDNPYWGKYTLGKKERVRGQYEYYTVYVINEESEVHSCNVSYSLWHSLNIGDKVIGKVNFFGHILSIEFPSGEVQEMEE